MSQCSKRNPSGRIRHSRHYLQATRVQETRAASTVLCVTPTRRLCSPTIVRTITANLHRPTSRITRTPSTWRRKPKSSTRTPWTLRQHTSRNTEETRASLLLRRHRKSSGPKNPSSRQAHIMHRSPIGRTERTTFSMRDTLSTHTTRFHSTEDPHTKLTSQSVRLES